MHLGVDVRRIRLVVYIAASALTGLAVAMSGSIGYIGLLVPHVMRMIFGSDHRLLIPASAFGGAIVLVIADTLARTIAAPSELPVGAITAIAGAPLFIYLLRRNWRFRDSHRFVRRIVVAFHDGCQPRGQRAAAQRGESATRMRESAASADFYAGSDELQAKSGEVVAILGPNARQIHTATNCLWRDATAFGPGSSEWICYSRFGTAHPWPAHRRSAAGKPTAFPSKAWNL
jgi:hypothetical protein